jgi:hypothetical protein
MKKIARLNGYVVIQEPAGNEMVEGGGRGGGDVIPLLPPTSFLSYRLARLHRLAESIPWNRFLGSLNINKFGLRLWVRNFKDDLTILFSSHRLLPRSYPIPKG